MNDVVLLCYYNITKSISLWDRGSAQPFFFSLQALAEEMDVQNERLGWLNKHAPQILASPTVSPQSRDQHVGKLRAINLNWSKVPALYPTHTGFSAVVQKPFSFRDPVLII